MSTRTTSAQSAGSAAIVRSALTVVAGFDPRAVARVGAALSRAEPAPVVITHDITALDAGTVRRTVTRGDTVVEDEVVTLEHGCLSCTIRYDVLPSLVRSAERNPGRDLVVVLPPTIEPQTLTMAVEHCDVGGSPVTDVIRLDSVIAVVEAGSFHDDLMSDEDLCHRGLAAAAVDSRAVAEVVSRQVEYADTVVTIADPDRAPDAFTVERLSALIGRLAPWSRRLTVRDPASLSGLPQLLLDTGRYSPEAPDVCARGLEGHSVGIDDLTPDCGIASMVFRARRPFHPERFHDRLGFIAERTMRGRGHLWLASQPAAVAAWESAGGGLSIGWLGHWLDALPSQRWDEAAPQRRVTASFEWDPYFADRSIQLAFIGAAEELHTVRQALEECLLTDHELAEGEQRWSLLPDPFDGCLTPESEEVVE